MPAQQVSGDAGPLFDTCEGSNGMRTSPMKSICVRLPGAIALLGISGAVSLPGCCPCPYAQPVQGAASHTSSSSGTSVAAPSVNYQWQSVVILGGGFVTGVIFSPVEKDLIYTRTDIGGAYRWNPADSTWTPITDMLGPADSGLLGIDSLAPDPKDANKVYLAVGMYTASWAGNGAMLRSSDRGNTWSRTDMPIKMGGNEWGRSNGERLAVDPNDTKILFFGSRRSGLWKSDSGSEKWEQVSSFPNKEESMSVGTMFVVFDAKSGSPGKPTPVIYAGWASTKDPSLYRSIDGGGNWSPVPKQPKGLMPSHAEFDKNGALYLSYANQPGPGEETTGGIWKYESKADVWTEITPLKPTNDDKFGYGGVSVDTQHPGTLMAVTMDRWTKGDEIFRTVDGGKTWAGVQAKAVRDDDGAKYLFWGKDKPSSVGWMGDVDIDPFNTSRAFYVTGQGIWMTTDASNANADKPTHWKFANRNLEETVAQSLISPPAGPTLLSGVGDICGFRHDDLKAPSPDGMFSNPICGGCSGLDYAESKPEIVVRVQSTDPDKAKGALSTDSGKSWTPFGLHTKGWGGQVALSADASTILWAPKEGSAVVSRDKGATWTRADGLPEPAKVADWAPVTLRIAADRVNPKKFYVYDAAGGKAYVSDDGAQHFKATASNLPALPEYSLTPASIRPVPGKEGDVWISTGKDLYRSTDSGRTFPAVNGIDEAKGVGFGKAADGKSYPAIYVAATMGGTYGFYRSDDEAKSWVRINDDQHQYGGPTIIIGDPRKYGRVYVGTAGRGIVYGDPK